MRVASCLVVWLALLSPVIGAEPAPVVLLKQAQRVVFLGDSITASGQYVALLDAWIVAQHWEQHRC